MGGKDPAGTGVADPSSLLESAAGARTSAYAAHRNMAAAAAGTQAAVAGGEAAEKGAAKPPPTWSPWGAAYPYAAQPPYGPYPQPHPFATAMNTAGVYPGMMPPSNLYSGMTVPVPGVIPTFPGVPSMSQIGGPPFFHPMLGGSGNMSTPVMGYPYGMHPFGGVPPVYNPMHPYGGMPPFPGMMPGGNSTAMTSMYNPFNPYMNPYISAYHPAAHYNMGYYHGSLANGFGASDADSEENEGSNDDDANPPKDYHVAMPPPLPSMAGAPGSGRGVHVAVHDATLVPVPGLTGRSPTAIAQEVARDREERGQKSPWSPYSSVFNNPMAFSETGHGMLHTTMAGDGFMAPPLSSYGRPLLQALNGGDAGSSMYPVTLPNGMTMNVPSDELAAYPNIMPGIMQGPIVDLSGGSLMGVGLDESGALRADGVNPWNARLAGTQAQIAQQQSMFNQYAMAGAQNMIGSQRLQEVLSARLASLQANLEQSKRQAEQQKKYLDQLARRSAALEVDKHRVGMEAQLAAVTMQYQQVRNRDEQLRQAQLKVNAAKEGLLKQAYAFRSVVRSDTEAIKKLVDPDAAMKVSGSGSEAGGEAGGERAKIEKDEKLVTDMQVQAATDNEKAAAKSIKAADAAVKQLESDPNTFVGAGIGSGSGSGSGSGAGGEAAR